jgi:NAD(P)-dependent dehydrogenase (short-subunit alcohol dehydrogenase family)
LTQHLRRARHRCRGRSRLPGRSRRADILIGYLEEHDDAKQTQRFVEDGRKAVLLAGDIQSAAHCRKIIETAREKLGGIDILVNNAAHQASF